MQCITAKLNGSTINHLLFKSPPLKKVLKASQEAASCGATMRGHLCFSTPGSREGCDMLLGFKSHVSISYVWCRSRTILSSAEVMALSCQCSARGVRAKAQGRQPRKSTELRGWEKGPADLPRRGYVGQKAKLVNVVMKVNGSREEGWGMRHRAERGKVKLQFRCSFDFCAFCPYEHILINSGDIKLIILLAPFQRSDLEFLLQWKSLSWHSVPPGGNDKHQSELGCQPLVFPWVLRCFYLFAWFLTVGILVQDLMN